MPFILPLFANTVQRKYSCRRRALGVEHLPEPQLPAEAPAEPPEFQSSLALLFWPFSTWERMAVENPRGIHPAGGLAAPICGGGGPSTPTAAAPWDRGWGEWPEPSPTLRWRSVAAAAGWWDLPPAVKHQGW